MTGRPNRIGPVLQSWMDEAACKGKLHLFFGPHNEQADKRRPRELKAKTICANCPVRSDCLEYALKHRRLEGIYGGWSDTERESFRRSMRKRSA